MSRDIHEIQYTRAELDALLNRSDNKPWINWRDEAAGVYRFFTTQERFEAWYEAYVNDELTPEIDALQFCQPITAPAPYTVNITPLTDNVYVLEGSTGNLLRFTFETRDGHEGLVTEAVDVYYTFRSPSGSKTANNIYNAGTTVELNIDDYLSLGVNNITILVRGRSTGTAKTIVVTFNVIRLNISSTFKMAPAIEPNTDFEVTYTIEGSSNKTVEFSIDGELKYTAEISSLETNATKVQRILNSDGRIVPGPHTLQIKAKVMAGNSQFYSKLLYYDFEVKGAEDTRVLISEVFPSDQNVFTGSVPGLRGEQYVTQTLNWAYYSSDPQLQTATVQWRLYTEAGVETTLATRVTDVVTAATDTLPTPISFMPFEYGDYKLQALILDKNGSPLKDEDGNVLLFGDYTISVIKNTSGIIEATDGMSMKLSGLGRDNKEPDDTKYSWADRGHACTFINMPFNNSAGYFDNAVVFNNGARGIIDIKPFSSDVNPTVKNGCTVELDIETFNVDDENAPVLTIGETNPSLIVYPTKAVLKSYIGTEIIANYKSDERVKLCFSVYPKDTSDYERKVFLYINGVMSQVIDYDLSDNYNIGNTTSGDFGKIKIGNEDGKAGIKVYYIRTYTQFITMYEEINNFFIDSGANLQQLVEKNDIYISGQRSFDIDKLVSKNTVVKFTGRLDDIIGKSGKGKVSGAMEVTSPTNPNINITCAAAEWGNAGQSTLDKPIPSFHVKLDKNGNVTYDRDGRMLPKNRWAFREGNTPEKKFRLQANFMDSSCAHNGAFMRMFNEIAPNVQVNGEYVLRTPAQRYALENYPSVMQAKYGEDKSGKNWAFPYKINMIPDSIPCIVIWRPTEDDPYQFLGQYVLMEEKKSNYANGMHSIYDGVTKENEPDPYGFKSSKSDNKLWDNKDCYQFELLTSTDDETLFLDDTNFDSKKEQTYELAYPDEDDLTPEEITSAWDKYKNEFLHKIVATKNNQSAFDRLYGTLLDRWHFASYYVLCLRNCCSDSLARNMEITTYDGKTWLPKWWDVDMQCGLSQTNRCDLLPRTDRTSLIPGTTNVFALSGRAYVNGVYKSSWLWDALENCEQFKQDVITIDQALYDKGWTYAAMIRMQDKEYVDAWSQSMYNESSITKYINTNDLVSLQGDRTPHRHNFLKQSYEYWDAKHVCGAYTKNIVSARTLAPEGSKFTIKAGNTNFFGWGTSISVDVSGVQVNKGNSREFIINRTLQYNNPLHIFGASNLEELDISNLASTIAAELRVDKVYDEVTGTYLKKLNIGVPFQDMKSSRVNTKFNVNSSFTGFTDGENKLTRLEELSIRGLSAWQNVNMSVMKNLKKFYAAGSSLSVFNPASSTSFDELELPTTIASISMEDCSIWKNNQSVIKWYRTEWGVQTVDVVTGQQGEGENAEPIVSTSEITVPIDVIETTVPHTITTMKFIGMGSDKGVQQLIIDWIRACRDNNVNFENLDLTYTNVNWEGISIADLLLLARIPTCRAQEPDVHGNRNPGKLTGWIKVTDTITSEDIVNLQEAFGPNIFSGIAGGLQIDATGGFILGAPSRILAGNSGQLTGISFPTSSAEKNVTYRLGYLNNGVFVPYTRGTDADNNHFYSYKNVKLMEKSGVITTTETTDATHTIIVEGSTFTTAQTAEIEIVHRDYPSRVDLSLTWSGGDNTSVDFANDEWYIVDNSENGVYITLEEQTTPVEVNGTLQSFEWIIDDSIKDIMVKSSESETKLILRVPQCPEDVVRGSIAYKRTYVEGTIVEDSLNFTLKSPKIAITSRVNPTLQTAMVANGVAKMSDVFTNDTECWLVDDLSTMINVEESQLQHLGELNAFINIDKLDVSNCTHLGELEIETQLEDNNNHFVDVLPARDIQLDIDLKEIDLSNTQLKGINLKPNSSLEKIAYGDKTTKVELIGQSKLTDENLTMPSADFNTDTREVTIKDCDAIVDLDMAEYYGIDNLVIEDNDNLETINL